MEFHPVLERLSRFLHMKPEIAANAYVAPNATVIGKVSIGSGSSVWYQVVIRGDINEIRFGRHTTARCDQNDNRV